MTKRGWPKAPNKPPPTEQRVCKAILLLAQDATLAEVSSSVRVHLTTLEKWQSSESFQTVLDLVREAYTLRDMSDALSDLTPDALDAFRRALSGPSVQWAVLAAREVLDRMERLAERRALHHAAKTMTVEFIDPDGQTVAPPPWAKRDYREQRALQSGRMRSPLRQDGDGQDHDSSPGDDQG